LALDLKILTGPPKISKPRSPESDLSAAHGGAMYTLYYMPATASFAVHWMLLEIGAPFELVKVDLSAKAQRTESYLALNPDGRVPTMIVDGKPRTECAALLMLLAERHPGTGLSIELADPRRPDFLQTMFYLANTLQPAFRAWFYAHEPAGPEHVEAVRGQARQAIETAWQRLDMRLADGRRYLTGPTLTPADFLATMLMRWSRDMPAPAISMPRIADYLHRMWELSSLRLAHEREGLTSDWIMRKR